MPTLYQIVGRACVADQDMELAMNRDTSLLVMNKDTSDAYISQCAEAVAQQDGHLACLLIGETPVMPFNAYGVPPYGSMGVRHDWVDHIQKLRKTLTARVEEIEAVLAKSGVSGDAQFVLCPDIEIKHQIARRARVSDIAHIAPNLRDLPDMLNEAAHGILFHSPVGLLMNVPPATTAKRIFVAWDSGETAARAVHVALPYLKEAESITVGCFDPVVSEERDGVNPGSELAKWLSHHDCNVTVTQYPSGGKEIGQSIQDRAKEIGADLIVMGAYGHARLLQAVFGGTTRTMIDQINLPVLMAH